MLKTPGVDMDEKVTAFFYNVEANFNECARLYKTCVYF